MKKELEKVLTVLSKNIGYTIVLVVAIVLFAVFSGGLVPGIITAGSALIGYACIEMLFKEYKNAPAETKSKPKPKQKAKARK